MSKFLDLTGLGTVWKKIKTYITENFAAKDILGNITIDSTTTSGTTTVSTDDDLNINAKTTITGTTTLNGTTTHLGKSGSGSDFVFSTFDNGVLTLNHREDSITKTLKLDSATGGISRGSEGSDTLAFSTKGSFIDTSVFAKSEDLTSFVTSESLENDYLVDYVTNDTVATTELAGLMSTEDKTNLDNLYSHALWDCYLLTILWGTYPKFLLGVRDFNNTSDSTATSFLNLRVMPSSDYTDSYYTDCWLELGKEVNYPTSLDAGVFLQYLGETIALFKGTRRSDSSTLWTFINPRGVFFNLAENKVWAYQGSKLTSSDGNATYTVSLPDLKSGTLALVEDVDNKLGNLTVDSTTTSGSTTVSSSDSSFTIDATDNMQVSGNTVNVINKNSNAGLIITSSEYNIVALMNMTGTIYIGNTVANNLNVVNINGVVKINGETYTSGLSSGDFTTDSSSNAVATLSGDGYYKIFCIHASRGSFWAEIYINSGSMSLIGGSGLGSSALSYDSSTNIVTISSSSYAAESTVRKWVKLF